MGALFDYFSQHASYQLFDIQEFLKIQNSPTKKAAITDFKQFVESLSQNKIKEPVYKRAKDFANQLRLDGYSVMDQAAFIEYWRAKEIILTRAKLRAIEDKQTMNHLRSYGEVFGSYCDETGSSSITTGSSNVTDGSSNVTAGSSNVTAGSSNATDGSDDYDDFKYESRESTPSSTSSNDTGDAPSKFYLVHDGDSYEYKLKKDSLRWIVDSYDVSDAFFKYRDEAISKAEDLKNLDDHEQLALDGIMLIDNQFYNSDIVDFDHIDAIMDDIENQEYFRQDSLEPSKQALLSRFAHSMAKKKIGSKKILDDIKIYQAGDGDAGALCIILSNLLSTYCPDFSTHSLNEATLVRDTVDIFMKSYFPNSALTKSFGADAMIKDSSKRFSRLDPSLACCGKRADFSVVSSKSNHILLSLEAKSNKTKYLKDLLKLCRELKDSIKGIQVDGYSDIPVCGILMKGNSCNVYVMDHAYDGLYRVVLLKRIYLPQDCYDMNQLLSIIPMFDKLKAIVHSSAGALRNRPAASPHIPENIVSMHTPTIVRTVKRSLDINNPNVKSARRKLFLGK